MSGLTELQALAALVQPDVLAKAMIRMRSFEKVEAVKLSAGIEYGSSDAGNMLGFSLRQPVGQPVAPVAPDYLTCVIQINVKHLNEDCSEPIFTLRPGDVLQLPYDHFAALAIVNDQVAEPTIETTPYLTCGWTSATDKLPSYPVSSAGLVEVIGNGTPHPLTVEGGTVGSAEWLPDLPCRLAYLQNVDEGSDLFFSMGLEAQQNQHHYLSPGEGRFLPVANLNLISINGGGGVTDWAATAFR